MEKDFKGIAEKEKFKIFEKSEKIRVENGLNKKSTTPLKIAFPISIPLTGFNLSIQNGIPEFPRLKGSPCLALTNITFVQSFKLFTPTIVQTYTRKDWKRNAKKNSSISLCIYLRTFVCVNVRVYVCMYVCVYVCTYLLSIYLSLCLSYSRTYLLTQSLPPILSLSLSLSLCLFLSI